MIREFVLAIFLIAHGGSAFSNIRGNTHPQKVGENVVVVDPDDFEGRLHQASDVMSDVNYAVWSIDDVKEFAAHYVCYPERVAGIWPVAVDCRGYLKVMVNRDKLKARQDKEVKELDKKLEEQKNKNAENDFRSVFWAGSLRSDLLGRHAQEYGNLEGEVVVDDSFGDFEKIISEGRVVDYGGRAYRLNGFGEASEKAKKVQLAVFQRKFFDDSLQVFYDAVIVFPFLAAFGFLIIFAYKKYGVAIAYVQGGFKAISGKMERRAVRSKVMDETIREMTRQALSEADEKSKRVLQDELVKAVENGNHELASALAQAIKDKGRQR